MRSPLPITVLAVAAVLTLAVDGVLRATTVAVAADEQPKQVVVERLDGEPIEGSRVTSLAAGEVVVETKTGPVKARLDDVISISFGASLDAARSPGAREVAVDLWSGESIRGTMQGGDGDILRVQSPVMGAVKIALDKIAGVRFLAALAQAVDPPDLRSRGDGDVIHLAGGDQFVATVEAFGDKEFACITPHKDRMTFGYDRLVAVRLMAAEKHAAPQVGMRLAMRDGTRIIGDTATLTDAGLKMKSVSGFEVSCAAADVVAAQIVSPRFAHLSDVPPSKVEVKPVWEMVAGDPAVLYAPRKDESFNGRPLRCGGRSWLDGIGTFSGTTMTYALDGAYREFRTTVGIDDGAGKLGGVIFKILVDGTEVWNSGFVRAAGTAGRGKAGPVTAPAVPLKDAKTLQLIVLAGDADDPYPVQDEADWLGPVLLRGDPSSSR